VSLSAVQYEKDNNAWKKLQMLIMQLRKCCNHPYLFPGAEPFFDGTTTGGAIHPAVRGGHELTRDEVFKGSCVKATAS